MKSLNLFVILLVLCLLTSIAIIACGDDDDDDDSADDDDDNDTSSADDDDNDSSGDDDDDQEGVWTDPTTGLTWTLDPVVKNKSWDSSVATCAKLEKIDKKDWRLPTISELRTIVSGCPATENGGSCPVTDSCLTLSCNPTGACECNLYEGPNNGNYIVSEFDIWASDEDYWWASQLVEDDDSFAWYIRFMDAGISGASRSSGSGGHGGSAYCVRSDTDDTYDDDPPDENYIWTDPVTSLMWQVDVSDNGSLGPEEAIEYCDSFSLEGFDDWRLPTISELRSLISGCNGTSTGGACGVTDDCLLFSCTNLSCNGCNEWEGPGNDGRYWPPELRGDAICLWSSSDVEEEEPFWGTWKVDFRTGRIWANKVTNTGDRARCVRN